MDKLFRNLKLDLSSPSFRCTPSREFKNITDCSFSVPYFQSSARSANINFFSIDFFEPREGLRRKGGTTRSPFTNMHC